MEEIKYVLKGLFAAGTLITASYGAREIGKEVGKDMESDKHPRLGKFARYATNILLEIGIALPATYYAFTNSW